MLIADLLPRFSRANASMLLAHSNVICDLFRCLITVAIWKRATQTNLCTVTCMPLYLSDSVNASFCLYDHLAVLYLTVPCLPLRCYHEFTIDCQ